MTKTEQITLSGEKPEQSTVIYFYGENGKAIAVKYKPLTSADPNDPAIA